VKLTNSFVGDIKSHFVKLRYTTIIMGIITKATPITNEGNKQIRAV
jgi:hypothetical protein